MSGLAPDTTPEAEKLKLEKKAQGEGLKIGGWFFLMKSRV